MSIFNCNLFQKLVCSKVLAQLNNVIECFDYLLQALKYQEYHYGITLGMSYANLLLSTGGLWIPGWEKIEIQQQLQTIYKQF